MSSCTLIAVQIYQKLESDQTTYFEALKADDQKAMNEL